MGDNLRKWEGTGADVGLKIIESHKIAATVPPRLVDLTRAGRVDAYETRKQEDRSIFKPSCTFDRMATRQISHFYTAPSASAAVQNDAPSSTTSLIKNCPTPLNTGNP
jgi:hypothetical protein